MKKKDKLIYVGSPLIIAVVTVLSGITIQAIFPTELWGLLFICTGVLCIPMFCVCSLLAKIIEKKNSI